MELIDKTTVLEEIYRLRDFANDRWDIEEMNGVDKFLDKLIPYINSLKVKEVELEKELESWRHNHFHGRRDKEASGEYLKRDSQLNLAKYFFELGIKVQNGE